MMHRTMEAGTQRVRDLLEAHAKKAEAGATQTVAGVVSVTVDSHLTLKAVQLLDASIDARMRCRSCNIPTTGRLRWASYSRVVEPDGISSSPLPCRRCGMDDHAKASAIPLKIAKVPLR
jgi:hypothetical protein